MTIENQDGDSPRAGRRESIGLAVIALPRVLHSMDLTVLNLAVPHLSADLMVAGSLITMGTGPPRITPDGRPCRRRPS
jgi:DHA2 family multidrug resistance protein-like MFS transporter